MAQHNDLGKEGEKEAREFLKKKGYVIRHTNWTSGKLELDIVAEKDGILIVVEVKTRADNFFIQPEDAVTSSKIKHIVQATDDYIRTFDLDMETRFDIIGVLPRKGGGYTFDHIEDAFMAPVN